MRNSEELEAYRRRIDEIDKRWVEILGERFAVTEAVGVLKSRSGIDAADPEREQRQRERLAGIARASGIDENVVLTIFEVITENVRARHRELGAK